MIERVDVKDKQYFLDLFENLKTNFSKDGKEIKFDYKENSDFRSFDKKRGYITDSIEAYIDGNKVGYISTGYMTKDSIKKSYPTIFHFMKKERGTGSIPERYMNSAIKITEFSESEMLYFLPLLGLSSFDFDSEKDNVFSLISDNQKQIKKFIHKAHVEYKKFIQYFIDKPYVDYINCGRNESHGLLNDNKGKGIGFALYCEMAKNLYVRGLNLYASSLQSEEAQKIWNSFKESGFVEEIFMEDKTRYFINFEKLVLYLDNKNNYNCQFKI